MTGVTLSFNKKTEASKDAMGDSVYSTSTVEVDDCLIAPVTDPRSDREQQAMAQSRDQVHIHFPKAFTGDVSNSTVDWDGKTFQLDNDSVIYMDGNTPTRWNRYTRAEAISG